LSGLSQFLQAWDGQLSHKHQSLEKNCNKITNYESIISLALPVDSEDQINIEPLPL
jgi:hypothetical protein